MFLDVQHRLQSLARTIADRIPLRLRTERPRSFRRMPVRARVVFWVLPNLAPIQPSQNLQRALPKLVLLSQTGLDERLAHEPDVPQLAPVRPAHHHPLRADPHELAPRAAVQFVRLALRTVDDGADDEVHHLRDGPERLVRRVLVLHHDELVALGERGAAQGRDGAGLVGVEDVQDEIVNRAVGQVEVDGGDVVPLRGPVDLVVVFGVQFLWADVLSTLSECL